MGLKLRDESEIKHTALDLTSTLVDVQIKVVYIYNDQNSQRKPRHV